MCTNVSNMKCTSKIWQSYTLYIYSRIVLVLIVDGWYKWVYSRKENTPESHFIKKMQHYTITPIRFTDIWGEGIPLAIYQYTIPKLDSQLCVFMKVKCQKKCLVWRAHDNVMDYTFHLLYYWGNEIWRPIPKCNLYSYLRLYNFH
jgi:hypothetical protein